MSIKKYMALHGFQAAYEGAVVSKHSGNNADKVFLATMVLCKFMKS